MMALLGSIDMTYCGGL